MRVLSVAPRGADAVGSLKICRGGTAVGETREEGGILILEYTPSNSCKAINLHPDIVFKFAVKALKTN